MAGKQSGSSRKIGRNSRSGGVTHTVTLYMSRNHKVKSTRGNLYHRPAGVCANCGATNGPFIAGPEPKLKVCGVRDPDRNALLAFACGKRRAALDWERYNAKLRAS